MASSGGLKAIRTHLVIMRAIFKPTNQRLEAELRVGQCVAVSVEYDDI